ncbi:MAG: patatin-like phospholipase family protein [Propionibacteriaceae bacterium]|jgi:NTE family protein|nr:patatin-like phospholipase family protein [Propionibacteriaceae bacterium]
MKVALALGSAGARGLAYVPVIEQLVARGHEIVAVAGTSMGSLIGGVYASGKLPEMKEWALGLNRVEVARLLDPTWPRHGLMRATGAMNQFRQIIGDVLIEDLPIPYTAVAADVINQQEVWIQDGDLINAIRASIAIPVVFTPVRRDGRLLVDGGVINPVPLEPLAGVACDITIAVSGHGAPTKPEAKAPTRAPSPLTLGILSIDAMETAIYRAKSAANPPDLLIEVPCDAASFLDLYKGAELFELGESLATAAFDTFGL